MHFQLAPEYDISKHVLTFPHPSPRRGRAVRLTSTHRVAGRGQYPPVGWCSNHGQTMKVKQYGLETCNRAIGMLQAGKWQRDAASHCGPSPHHQTLVEGVGVGSVANRPWPVRPSSISTVGRIVMKKAAGKSDHAARKLSKRLTRKNCPVSEKADRRYSTLVEGVGVGSVANRPWPVRPSSSLRSCNLPQGEDELNG